MGARGKMALAMSIFGTISLFVKRLPLASGEIVLYRAVLACVVIGLFLVLTGRPIPLERVKGELPLLLLSGAAVGINWLLLFQAYRYTSVSVATLCYYFAPVLITAACPILFRERLSRRQAFCFAMSTLGLCLVVSAGGLEGGGSNGRGIALGLGAAVFYAAAVLMNKAIRNTGGIHRTLIQLFGAALTLLAYVPFTGGFHLGALDAGGWLCLVILGVVHTGLAYCLYFSSLTRLSGQQTAILSYIDPLVAVAVSVLLLHEPISPLQTAGGAMILGFTLLNELGGGK